MKRTRIIVGALAAVAAIALCACVSVQWYKHGCGAWSLFAACLWYLSCTAAVWMVIDAKIKEREQ